MLGLYAALCYCSTRLSARPIRSDIMACWETKMEITHKWVIIDAASQPACLPASQPASPPACLLASGVPSTNADDVHGTRETRMYQTCCHLAIRHEHAPLARLTLSLQTSMSSCCYCWTAGAGVQAKPNNLTILYSSLDFTSRQVPRAAGPTGAHQTATVGAPPNAEPLLENGTP